jgi:competence protein ComEC
VRAVLWSVAFPIAVGFLSAAYFQLRDRHPNAFAESPSSERLLRLEIERIFLGAHADSDRSKRVSGIGRVLNETVSTRPGDSRVRASHARARADGELVYFAARIPPNETARALRTAIITVRGTVEAVPPSPAPHSFDEYLQSAGVTAKLSRGRLIRFERLPSRYAAFCETLRLKISRILGLGLGARPELAAENRALFLGEVAGLGDERKQLFVDTGTLHFFAIDGLHIAAVAVALHILFGLTRCPKLVAFLITGAALWLYADLTGRSPSAVRAVLTVLFFEGAYLLRRPINPLAGLSASAVIALFLSPRELFGASFQMSYGIVAGLLLLGLPVAERWQARWVLFRHLPRVSWRYTHHAMQALQRHLISGVAIGIATALVADVCGVLFFQKYSPSSLLANLVLIPAASLALWANFCAAVCGLAHAGWPASIFNHASALILIAMEKCIRFLVTLPWAVLPREFSSTRTGFIVMAVLLVTLLGGYALRWSWRFGAWLPPIAITVLALVFLTK